MIFEVDGSTRKMICTGMEETKSRMSQVRRYLFAILRLEVTILLLESMKAVLKLRQMSVMKSTSVNKSKAMCAMSCSLMTKMTNGT
jgi:hypothetical protein